MPKTPEQCEQIRNKMKTYIMDKSLAYFAKRGLAGTKISQLSKEIGIGQGTLYSYFTSKEELFQAIIERAVKESSKALKQLLHIPLSPKDKIIMLSEMMIRTIYEKEGGAETFVLNVQVKMEYGEGNELTREYRELPQAILVSIIEEGQKTGEFVEGNPEMLADFYWTAVHALSVNKICANAPALHPTSAQLIRILIKDDFREEEKHEADLI